MKKLIIARMEYQKIPCLALAQEEEGRLCSLQIEKDGKRQLLGSIHVGKVQKVLPNIQGAFVEIENRLPCYYPYTRNQHPIYTNEKKTHELKAGDELLVQVTQESIKMKAPCVSSNLSFPGKYLVLTTENRKLGVSAKIPGEKREELRLVLEEILPDDRDYGVIVRTNAGDARKELIIQEFFKLQTQMKEVMKKGSYSPCFTRIQEGSTPVIQALRDLYWDEMEKIVTDDPLIYDAVCEYQKGLESEKRCQLQMYQDSLLPLYKLYRLEHGLEEALQEKVWLKSGGFLIIQQTEAFVAVDVNSGKHTGKKQVQETYRKINLEAVKEIARQLRLRNLSGMILIDFINMRKYEDRTELLRVMDRFVKSDRVPTSVVDVTALGIMELTRKKEKKSLKEQLQQLSQV